MLVMPMMKSLLLCLAVTGQMHKMFGTYAFSPLSVRPSHPLSPSLSSPPSLNNRVHAVSRVLQQQHKKVYGWSALLATKEEGNNAAEKTRARKKNYDQKRSGIIRHVDQVGEGSVMLHIEATMTHDKSDDTGKDAVLVDDDDDVDESMLLDYEPGNVLALEIQPPASTTSFSSEKNANDTANNGGWMRGPYTISRATDSTFDVMIKVVGDKSKTFAAAEPGTAVRFNGKYKVPIFTGIDKENTDRVVLISTGVGIGPCIGTVEQFLFAKEEENNGKKLPLVELFASFRNEEEVVYRKFLDDLAEQHPEKFKWHPIITSQVGRLSSSLENLQTVTRTNEEEDSTSGASAKKASTHYHLIGNGQMVNEWKEGLSQAGVPDGKVTIESYFNHRAETSKDAIRNVATAFSATATSGAEASMPI